MTWTWQHAIAYMGNLAIIHANEIALPAYALMGLWLLRKAVALVASETRGRGWDL